MLINFWTPHPLCTGSLRFDRGIWSKAIRKFWGCKALRQGILGNWQPLYSGRRLSKPFEGRSLSDNCQLNCQKQIRCVQVPAKFALAMPYEGHKAQRSANK